MCACLYERILYAGVHLRMYGIRGNARSLLLKADSFSKSQAIRTAVVAAAVSTATVFLFHLLLNSLPASFPLFSSHQKWNRGTMKSTLWVQPSIHSSNVHKAPPFISSGHQRSWYTQQAYQRQLAQMSSRRNDRHRVDNGVTTSQKTSPSTAEIEQKGRATTTRGAIGWSPPCDFGRQRSRCSWPIRSENLSVCSCCHPDTVEEY